MFISSIVTARKRSLAQGNVFTSVCHFIHWRDVGLCHRDPLDRDPIHLMAATVAGGTHPTGMHSC